MASEISVTWVLLLLLSDLKALFVFGDAFDHPIAEAGPRAEEGGFGHPTQTRFSKNYPQNVKSRYTDRTYSIITARVPL